MTGQPSHSGEFATARELGSEGKILETNCFYLLSLKESQTNPSRGCSWPSSSSFEGQVNLLSRSSLPYPEQRRIGIAWAALGGQDIVFKGTFGRNFEGLWIEQLTGIINFTASRSSTTDFQFKALGRDRINFLSNWQQGICCCSGDWTRGQKALIASARPEHLRKPGWISEIDYHGDFKGDHMFMVRAG